MGHASSVHSVAFSPDGKLLASGSCVKTVLKDSCNQGEIRIWDVATRQPIGLPLAAHRNWVNSVAFSRDGKTLASGSSDNTVILWNVATRQPLGPALTGHKDAVLTVAFSPDGRLLASGGKEGTIILWDMATHQRLNQPLRGHLGEVYSLAFSPDSRTLASSSNDRDIILWDVSFESWKSRACGIVNRNLTKDEWNKFIGSDMPYQSSCPDLPPGK